MSGWVMLHVFSACQCDLPLLVAIVTQDFDDQILPWAMHTSDFKGLSCPFHEFLFDAYSRVAQ